MRRDKLKRLERLEQARGGGAVHVVREAEGDPQTQINALIAAGAHPHDLFVVIKKFSELRDEAGQHEPR